MSSLFVKNILAVEKRFPNLAERLKTIRLSKKYLPVRAKSGGIVLNVFCNGKEYLLCSKYDPVKEASKLAATYDYAPTSDLVFSGFGCGYHILEVLKRKNSHGVIAVVEADIELFRHIIEYIDITPIVRDERIYLFVGESLNAVYDFLTNYALSILANSISLLEYPAAVRLAPSYYEGLRKTVRDVYSWAKVNANTQISKSREFAGNVIANYGEMLENPGVASLFGLFKNIPVFVVSAGPSLDKNADYLKLVGDKGVIISVDSAFKGLVDRGIIPDIVVSIDFGERNKRYLEDVDTSGTALVFDPEVYPDIPRNYNGKKFSIHLPGKSLSDWFAENVVDKGAVEKGMSVSHTAFLLAYKMGGNPIVLVGQDLAYTGDNWHAKGSDMFQKIDMSKDIEKKLIDVDGYFGGVVKSEVSFNMFIKHFEAIFKDADVKVINATEGGANIKGAESRSLKDVICRYCSVSVRKKLIFENVYFNVDEDKKKFFVALERIAKKLRKCNCSSYRAYGYIEEMIRECYKHDVDKKKIFALYENVVETVKEFNEDREVLDFIKDSAVETLIIRAKRETDRLNKYEFDRDIFLRELRKERAFFKSLINATDFLCSLVSSQLDVE